MRIAILDDYLDAAKSLADWSALEERCEITVFTEYLADEDTVAAALRDFECIVAMRERTPIPASLLERLPNLRLLVTTGMRNASIDMAAARARGITICGTGSSKGSTSEQAWALILGLARNISQDDRTMHADGWQNRLGIELAGRTLGLLGLGSIGEMVARVGLAFGMDVIAWSQNLTDERAAACGVTRVDKDDLFQRADFLSIHLVLGDRSRGLVGAREIGLMKSSAYLVNTSRAPIVDYAAMLGAIERGKLAGAGIDVYESEPVPADHPLRRSEKLLLTPHMGYVTDRNIARMYTEAAENIASFLEGRPTRILE